MLNLTPLLSFNYNYTLLLSKYLYCLLSIYLCDVPTIMMAYLCDLLTFVMTLPLFYMTSTFC